LVVDDEASIVDAVATALRYEGFDVREATTGRAALAAAQEDPPDLVVLDVMLPDLDGIEVTRRLRADGIRVPVLFLTARDSVEDKVAGLTVGGDDYVTKPFSLAEIVARTHAILRRTHVEANGDGNSASRTSRWIRTPTRCGEQATPCASQRQSSTSSGSSCSTRAECSRRARSSTTCGTTTSAAIRMWSRPT
jgi:DNA-binding response OmpR family regulator